MKWRKSNYACPDCGSRLVGKSGPDGISVEKCESCGWDKVFDPDADESAVKELESWSI